MAGIPTNVAQLMAVLNLNTLPFEANAAKAAGMMSSGGLLAMGAAGLGVIMAGTGIIATKMAGDFQAGLTSLVTGAGESQKNLKLVSDGILQMSMDTGTSTKQLIDGMYMIESGGFHGAAGLAILKAAAEGAKVGSADLGTVADTVDTILKNFGENGALTATQATNALITTVANGKTHLEDLANSLSSVLPAGAAAGLGLNSVLGAMSTLTGGGINAAESATYLRQMIIALEAPSSSAKTALSKIGITTDELAAHMKRGLPDALAFIRKQLDAHGIKEGSAQYVAAIREISGGTRQMQAMLYLLGGEGTTQDHLKTLALNVGKIGTAASTTGNQVTGWALVQKNMNQQFDRFKNTLGVLLIGLGQQLLPVATKLFGFLADTALPAIKNFATWISDHVVASFKEWTKQGGPLYGALKALPDVLAGIHHYFELLGQVWREQIMPNLGIFKVIAIVIGVVLLASVVAMVGAFLILVGIIVAVVLIITKLGQGIGWLFSKFGVFKQGIQVTINAIGAVLGWLGDRFGELFGHIGNFVGGVIAWFANLGRQIHQKVSDFNTTIINFFASIPGTIHTWLSKAAARIGEFKDQAIAKAEALATNFINALKSLPGKLLDLGKQLMKSLADGIRNGASAVANAVKNVPLLGGAMADVSKGVNILTGKLAAQGGVFGEGEWGVVGENNPEAIRVQNGRAIITPLSGGRLAASPAGMGGGAGSGAITIVVQTNLDGRRVAQSVAQHLPGAIRNTTGRRNF